MMQTVKSYQLTTWMNVYGVWEKIFQCFSLPSRSDSSLYSVRKIGKPSAFVPLNHRSCAMLLQLWWVNTWYMHSAWPSTFITCHLSFRFRHCTSGDGCTFQLRHVDLARRVVGFCYNFLSFQYGKSDDRLDSRWTFIPIILIFFVSPYFDLALDLFSECMRTNVLIFCTRLALSHWTSSYCCLRSVKFH